jgi:CelD/BcsL family acetyltransferase involved in cellulose biosynthesis
MQDVSGSFRRNLRRLARRAEESASLTYRVVSDPGELGEAVNVFLRVEASGWKGLEGANSAIVCEQALVDFYGCLAQTFGATGECVICLLQHGDRTVAAQFCLRVNGTVSILKIGYDEAAAAIAPGNLNMERTIRAAAETSAVRELSFVTSPPWGHLWKPRQEAVRSYTVFNDTVRGRFLFFVMRSKRGLAQWYRRAARFLATTKKGSASDLIQGNNT